MVKSNHERLEKPANILINIRQTRNPTEGKGLLQGKQMGLPLIRPYWKNQSDLYFIAELVL